MRIIRHHQLEFSKALESLQRHAQPSPDVESSVRAIIAAVRNHGDDALCELTERFGGPKLAPNELRIRHSARVDATTKRAITAAHRNVRAFARRGLRKSWTMKNAEGGRVGERFDPFQRVGVYVPGGSAPLVSTAIMTITLAAAAGVPQIVAATPSDKAGTINDALLYALQFAGATEIYRIGGAQAIAALAFGTETIAPVAKIFGPGNAYVVEAKRQVFGQVGIDLLPGPSEILVLADASANPAWIAADLLAQAEHGTGSKIVLVTTSATLLASVEQEIAGQIETLSRGSHLRSVLERDATLILVRNIAAAIHVANDFAPEHISIVAKAAEKIAARIRTSGAIFIGGYSPVAAGDFLAGPSHTLPTGGAGKSFSGLTVEMFQRRTSIVRLDARALRRSVQTITKFSAMEGLDAHGRSATIRFDGDVV